jgi:hypothetical protein
MLESIWGLATLALSAAGGIFAFGFARGFVRRRMRFVDAVRSPFVPVLAAVGGALVILPLTALPLVTGLTAALIGAGTGLGTRSGVKALERGDV